MLEIIALIRGMDPEGKFVYTFRIGMKVGMLGIFVQVHDKVIVTKYQEFFCTMEFLDHCDKNLLEMELKSRLKNMITRLE